MQKKSIGYSFVTIIVFLLFGWYTWKNIVLPQWLNACINQLQLRVTIDNSTRSYSLAEVAFRYHPNERTWEAGMLSDSSAQLAAAVATPKILYGRYPRYIVSYCGMELEVNLKNESVVPHDEEAEKYFDIENIKFRSH